MTPRTTQNDWGPKFGSHHLSTFQGVPLVWELLQAALHFWLEGHLSTQRSSFSLSWALVFSTHIQEAVFQVTHFMARLSLFIQFVLKVCSLINCVDGATGGSCNGDVRSKSPGEETRHVT